MNKRYDEYKPTGVEWLPEVPMGWDIKKLKHCFKFTVGGTPTTSKASYFEGENTWVTIADMHQRVVSESKTGISDEAIVAASMEIVPEGSLMYSFKLSVGKVAFAGKDLYTNEAIFSVLPEPEYDLTYFYFALPELLIHSAGQNIYGAKIFNQELLKNAFIALLSLAEQRAIAQFLDAKTAQLDQLIAQKQQMLALLREERAALINHAVTKGLDAGVPMRDSGIAWLGEVPAHWEVKRLKWIAEIQGGVALSAGKKLENPVALPYLRVANVQDGYLDLTEVKTVEVEADQVDRYTLRKGDLLMNEGGDNDKLGRGCVWQGEMAPCLHQNHVFAVRLFDGYDPEWLNLITVTEGARVHFLTRAKQSTNLASISSTNIKELPVLLPPIAEQQEIMALVAAETARVTEITATVNQEIALLQEYRAALIAEGVTGQIDVRHYEPALEAALV